MLCNGGYLPHKVPPEAHKQGNEGVPLGHPVVTTARHILLAVKVSSHLHNDRIKVKKLLSKTAAIKTQNITAFLGTSWKILTKKQHFFWRAIPKIVQRGTLWVGRGSNPWGRGVASPTPSSISATDKSVDSEITET